MGVIKCDLGNPSLSPLIAYGEDTADETAILIKVSSPSIHFLQASPNA